MLITEWPTNLLLMSAENCVRSFMAFVDGNRGGMMQEQVSAISLPVAVACIRELERRGIDTGHSWLVQIYDDEVN